MTIVKSNPFVLLLGAGLLGIFTPPLLAETVRPENFFKQQILLAQSQHRYDIADAALEHWLAIDKNDPQALFFQVQLNILKGEKELAKKNIAAFERTHPNHELLGQLKNLFEASVGSNKLQLQQAHFLAGNQRIDEALDIYNRLFPNGMPTTEIEIDYLKLLAKRSAADLETAIQKLKEHNAQYPDNPDYKLALASVESKKSPTNKEPIAVFEKLSTDDGFKIKAASAWKDALSNIPIEKLTQADIDRFARAYPEDLSVKSKITELNTALSAYKTLINDPAYQAKLKGFELLKNNKADAAEQKFSFARNLHPKDPQVFNGLGRVRLNQSKYEEALVLFMKGKRLEPNRDNDGEWDSLILAAQFWAMVNRADKLLETNQAGAIALYKKAIQLDSTQAYPFVAIGKVLAKNKNFEQADAYFAKALHLEFDNKEALLGRLNLRVDNNKPHDALALAEKYTAAQKKLIADDIAALKIDIFVNESQAALDNHDLETANKKINSVLSLKTLNPWRTYQAADVLNQLNRGEEAEKFIKQLVANIKPNSESYFASSLYLARQNKLQEALAEMDKIPAAERTPSVIKNQQRIWLTYQFGVLENLLLHDKQQAHEHLSAIEPEVIGDVNLSLKVANYWLDIDDIERSKKLTNSLSRDEKWTLSNTLNYADLLFKLKDFEKLAALEKDIDLLRASTQEQLQYHKLMLQVKTLQARKFADEGNKISANQLYFSILQQDPLFVSIYQNLAKLSENAPDEKARNLTISWVEHHIDELANPDAYSDFPVIRKIQMLAKYEQLETAEKLMQALLADKKSEDRALYNASEIALTMQKWDIAEQLSYAALAKNKAKNAEDTPVEFAQAQKKQLYQDTTTEDDWLAKNVKSNIDTLRQKTDGYISVSSDYTSTAQILSSNDPNASTGAGTPIEAKIPIAQMGFLTARIDPILFSSGTQISNAKDFGSSLLCANNDCGKPNTDMTGKGAGYSIGWMGQNWKIDIGRTPENFLVTDVVGGVRVDGDFGAVSWAINASKHPLTNSTLAYAGLIDPNTGKVWGGARQTGVALNVGFDNGSPVGVWSSWQYHQITGKNIKDNTKFTAMAGTYWGAWQSDSRLLNLDLGLNALYMNYKYNLSQLTLGHGGYYSPKSYLSFSVPVTIFGRFENWAYSVRGAGSYSMAKVDDAPYFPNDPDLQAQAQSIEGENPYFTGSSSTGFSRSIGAIVVNQLTEHWSIGARLQMQFSPFYNPSHVGMFLKYDFNERWKQIDLQPQLPATYADF